MINKADANHLMIVETYFFDPMGFLYRSIFSELKARGLVEEQSFGAYIISEAGRVALKEYRARRA